ncbi:glycosyltransferase [Membranihabitans marinus]|uniref:glycosyltransferase n=1 Tax=Membranihabitans marinus TaxID=1227546 RepID=UPI001F2E5BF5|nr:glycosyltransferase [Membranihabitans marinus]
MPFKTIDFFLKANYPSHNYEVIIWDDGSSKDIRDSITKYIAPHPNFKLKWQNENIGRAKMRQKILSSHSEQWAVFLDSDMVPMSGFFQILDDHLNNINAVYSGGFQYPQKINHPELLLHWIYGTQRETKSQHGFKTGLFAVHQSTIKKLSFDTSFTQYGHEDTVLGHQLKLQEIKIELLPHLATHTGLHSRTVFIQHQLQAVENLVNITDKYPSLQTSLIKWGNFCSKSRLLTNLLTMSFTKNISLRILHSKTPRLWALDVLKLSHYIENKKNRI